MVETMGSDQPKPHAIPEKLSPEDPAARDEGPRLIPLKERRRQPRSFEPNARYLELADIAIRKRKKVSD